MLLKHSHQFISNATDIYIFLSLFLSLSILHFPFDDFHENVLYIYNVTAFAIFNLSFSIIKEALSITNESKMLFRLYHVVSVILH